MKVWSPLTIGLVAGAAVILIAIAIAIYLKLHRKKDPAEIERLRRLALCRTGRITAGEITGLIEPDGENATQLQLVYRYVVSGVSYEVAQDVSAMPRVAAVAARLVGKSISAKYDMKHPSNSIVICEEWSGIRGIDLRKPEAADVPLAPGANPVEQGEPQTGG